MKSRGPIECEHYDGFLECALFNRDVSYKCGGLITYCAFPKEEGMREYFMERFSQDVQRVLEKAIPKGKERNCFKKNFGELLKANFPKNHTILHCLFLPELEACITRSKQPQGLYEELSSLMDTWKPGFQNFY